MPLRPAIRLAATSRSKGASFSPLIATARPLTKSIATDSTFAGAFMGHTPIVGSTIVIAVSRLSRSSASCERPARLPSVE